MKINRKTLDLARQWARSGDEVSLVEMEAAEKVIKSLPDQWVSAEKVRGIVEDWRANAVSPVIGGLLRELETLLPAPPTPPMEIKMGVWAMHPEHGKVMIVSARPDINGKVMIACENRNISSGTSSIWVNHTDLSPLSEDKPAPEDAFTKTDDDHAPEGGPAEDVPEFDPAYLYRDRECDTWRYQGGTWEHTSSYNPNIWLGVYSTPPAEYGPYTRINKEDA